jgi:hypothetical protein
MSDNELSENIIVETDSDDVEKQIKPRSASIDLKQVYQHQQPLKEKKKISVNIPIPSDKSSSDNNSPTSDFNLTTNITVNHTPTNTTPTSRNNNMLSAITPTNITPPPKNAKRTSKTGINSPVEIEGQYTENMLLQIGKVYENAMSLKWLHDYCADACAFRSKVISLPTRVLSSLIGTGSAINLIINHGTFSSSDYILNSITIIGSVLSIIESFADYQTREMQHKHYRSSFLEVINHIEFMLTLPENERENSALFLNNIKLKVSHLSNGQSPNFIYGAKNKLEQKLKSIGENTNFEGPATIHSLKKHFRHGSTIDI